jgi:hypothetical protein
MAKQVIVNISPAGTVKADAKGFSGSECTKATEQIEVVLGGIATTKKKPEYFAPPSASGTNVNNRSGF